MLVLVNVPLSPKHISLHNTYINIAIRTPHTTIPISRSFLTIHCFKAFSLLIKGNAYTVKPNINNLVEAHCYGIGRTGQIFEQSRSSIVLTKTFAVETSTFLSVSSLLRDCSKICPVKPNISRNMLLFAFCRYCNGSSHCDDYSLYSCLDSISTWFASQDKCLPCRYNLLSH